MRSASLIVLLMLCASTARAGKPPDRTTAIPRPGQAPVPLAVKLAEAEATRRADAAADARTRAAFSAAKPRMVVTPEAPDPARVAEMAAAAERKRAAQRGRQAGPDHHRAASL